MHRTDKLSDIEAKFLKKGSLGLAPMEGVTDLAFRLWIALTSPPAFMWTPFMRATDSFPKEIPPSYAPELKRLKGLVPFRLIPQVMASKVEDFSRTAELLLKDVDFVDLNCGCPSPTVVGSKAGSSLLESSSYFFDFVSRVVENCGPNSVSVKMRTGYNDPSEFQGLISVIKGLPLAQLTIHGRTRPQRYTGYADWNLIASGAQNVSFPVVGSGDIVDQSSALERFGQCPRLQALIVGRGALRNPWIFGGHAHVPLIEALAVFALLQDYGISSSDFLLKFAESGGVLTKAGSDAQRWEDALTTLAHIGGRPRYYLSPEVSPRAFARVKMIWSYMRSSLPACFMDPLVLRTKNLGEFFEFVKKIGRDNGLNILEVPLVYRKDLDWMYSGAGRST
jgi:tRNA-dihydrouridine synthase